MNKNILTLKSSKACDFFLKEESYCKFKLPQYFRFNALLKEISTKLNGKKLSDFYETNTKPMDVEGINYKLVTNKDGKYEWRPLQLIHPAFYVYLVHEITKENNWKHIVDRLNALMEKSTKIKCASMPVVSKYYKKDTASQIDNWIKEVEKESVISSLEYDYLFHTDITDCYGSLYTHSIAWALHGKDEAKNDKGKNNALIGNVIDRQIQLMSYGQTNGIPQGSVLMDFIAEIVLCYVDYVLYEKIKTLKLKEYKIIRYKDDYRIFVNNPQAGEQIIKELTEIIYDFGMKINSAKTLMSDHITHGALKPDKLYWMVKKTSPDSLQNDLYKISFVAKKFPNSGTLVKLLQIFYDRISDILEKDLKKDINVLIGILVDIAYKNPRTYPKTSAILSKFIDLLPKRKKMGTFKKILKKFEKIPNTGIMQLWLQRIAIKLNNKLNYTESLCKKVAGKNIVIWDSTWLQSSLKKLIDSFDLIDRKKLAEMGATIEKEEIELFDRFDSDYY